MHTLYESEAPRAPPLAASLGAPLGLSGGWRPRSIPWGPREGTLQEGPRGGPPLGALQAAAGEGQITAVDVEVYAYQLEAAVAASNAFRMKRQATMLSELLQHNVALLRQHAITKHRHRNSSSSCSSSSSSSSSELGSCSFLSSGAPPLLCPPPPTAATTASATTAATAAAAAAADGDTSWLFDFPAVAAAPQAAGQPSQRSLWGRSLERGPLEAELQAAVGGPQGGLQWLHALSLIASDDQAAQSIIEFAAADPGFPCEGVKRQILLALCSLSVEGTRVNGLCCAAEEQRIGRIIRKMTEAGALQEKKAAAAAAAAAAAVAATAAAERKSSKDASAPIAEEQQLQQQQQQLQQQLQQQEQQLQQQRQQLQQLLLEQQSTFAGDEAWAFLWHLVGLLYQREAASSSSSQAAFRRCSALCFLCALQLSPFSLCCLEAALPVAVGAAAAAAVAATAAAAVGAAAAAAVAATAAAFLSGRPGFSFAAAAAAAAAVAAVCSDTSFFLLVPPRQSPSQILDAALNPKRVAKLMQRYCCLLLLQQQQAASRLQQQLQQQQQRIQSELHAVQQDTQYPEGPVLQQRRLQQLLQQQLELQEQQQQQQQWLQQLHKQQQRRWELQQNEAVWKAGSRLLSHTLRGSEDLHDLMGFEVYQGQEALDSTRFAALLRVCRKAAKHPAASGGALVGWAAAAARQKAIGELLQVSLIALDRLSPEEPYFCSSARLMHAAVAVVAAAAAAVAAAAAACSPAQVAIHLGDFFSEAFALCGGELTQQNQLEQLRVTKSRDSCECCFRPIASAAAAVAVAAAAAGLRAEKIRRGSTCFLLLSSSLWMPFRCCSAAARALYVHRRAANQGRSSLQAVLHANPRAVAANPREGGLRFQLGKLQLEAAQYELNACIDFRGLRVCVNSGGTRKSSGGFSGVSSAAVSHVVVAVAAGVGLHARPAVHVLLSKAYSKLGEFRKSWHHMNTAALLTKKKTESARLQVRRFAAVAFVAAAVVPAAAAAADPAAAAALAAERNFDASERTSCPGNATRCRLLAAAAAVAPCTRCYCGRLLEQLLLYVLPLQQAIAAVAGVRVAPTATAAAVAAALAAAAAAAATAYSAALGAAAALAVAVATEAGSVAVAHAVFSRRRNVFS
ncbi:hypothetical protein Emag_005010 [Eimeria magna]